MSRGLASSYLYGPRRLGSVSSTRKTVSVFRRNGSEAVGHVLAFVVRTLTGPYHGAVEAEFSSLPCRMVIDGVIVEFRPNALRTFTDTIWQFVSQVADKVDEPTLAAFRGARRL